MAEERRIKGDKRTANLIAILGPLVMDESLSGLVKIVFQKIEERAVCLGGELGTSGGLEDESASRLKGESDWT
jgi:hypothetical protein